MPKVNHPDMGDVQKHIYSLATITAIDSDNDTADIILENGEESTAVPLFYHCAMDSVQRENGALEGAAGAFSIDDSVIARCCFEVAGDPLAPVCVVGFEDGPKACIDWVEVRMESKYWGLITPDNIYYIELKNSDQVTVGHANSWVSYNSETGLYESSEGDYTYNPETGFWKIFVQSSDIDSSGYWINGASNYRYNSPSDLECQYPDVYKEENFYKPGNKVLSQNSYTLYLEYFSSRLTYTEVNGANYGSPTSWLGENVNSELIYNLEVQSSVPYFIRAGKKRSVIEDYYAFDFKVGRDYTLFYDNDFDYCYEDLWFDTVVQSGDEYVDQGNDPVTLILDSDLDGFPKTIYDYTVDPQHDYEEQSFPAGNRSHTFSIKSPNVDLYIPSPYTGTDCPEKVYYDIRVYVAWWNSDLSFIASF